MLIFDKGSRQERALRAIYALLCSWQKGSITVALGLDDMDEDKRIYDLRTVIAAICNNCCEGLGIDIDALGPWPKQYPVKSDFERNV